MKVLEIEPLEKQRLGLIFLDKDTPEEDIEDMLKAYEPEFVAVENELMEECINVFQNDPIPVYPVGVSEYAEIHISVMMDEKRELVEGMAGVNDPYAIGYSGMLEEELKQAEEEMITVREAWMVMGILDRSREIEKSALKAFFIGETGHWERMRELLESVGVETETTTDLISPTIPKKEALLVA